jgi:hypothetical protein
MDTRRVCLKLVFEEISRDFMSASMDPRKNNFRILGARIWVSFVRSGGA